jgi:hypothetical protein
MKTQTMKKKWLLNNEDGSVLILSLIILVVLTLIGIAASRTASIEIQISGNEVIYKQNLYMAEAAAMEAAQNLENTNLSTNPPAWVHGLGTVDEAAEIPDPTFWVNANSVQSAEAGGHFPVETRLLSVHEGIISGGSLDMSKTKVHSYAIYGRCQENRGVVVIKVGYRKAFK